MLDSIVCEVSGPVYQDLVGLAVNFEMLTEFTHTKYRRWSDLE